MKLNPLPDRRRLLDVECNSAKGLLPVDPCNALSTGAGQPLTLAANISLPLSVHSFRRLQREAERVREVCVVPVAFVSDHVETLGEIDHEARELALRLGFAQFEMSAGLNDSPAFIRALGRIVIETLEASAQGVVGRAEAGLVAVG